MNGIGADALHTYFGNDALIRSTVYKTKKNLAASSTISLTNCH